MLYYPLHVHTSTGSIGDSILSVPEYIQTVKKYGLNAAAITDHGSMSTMYSFITECGKNNIKPIVGMEAYVVENNNIKFQQENKITRGKAGHLVLLAKNSQGLENLLRIHNQAATEGYYYEVRTDWSHLLKWGEGIVALSACVGGEIPRAVIREKKEEAKKLIEFYKECFDEFYLEIQPGKFEEQIKTNHELIKFSNLLDVPLIITNDVHYLNAEDAILHDYYVKLGRHSSEEKMIYPDTVYWLMNTKNLIDSFCYDEIITKDVILNAIKKTEEIANKCNIVVDEKISMPIYTNSKNEDELLYEKCFNSLNRIIEKKANPQEYIDRLVRELDVIKVKGFSGYFLIVADYIEWAKEHDIPIGPGRGSAAGSLVTYLLGICQADPIKYHLLFERFLDPKREAIPDIDIDMSPDGREHIFNYVTKKYGQTHCSQVSTLVTRKVKGAIRDAARILGYKPKVGDEIAKLIPVVYYDDNGDKQTELSIEDAVNVTPKLRKYLEAYPDIFKLAKGLAGLPYAKGVHAAGVIISPVELNTRIPLVKSENMLATSLTLEDAEKMFVKFDFLVLGTLNIMKKVEDDAGIKFDYQNDELFEDPEVWKVISSHDTTGIFQISSKTYKKRMPRLKPGNIEELAACLALIRGPAISAKTDELYMRIIEGREEIKHLHPIYDEITKKTNGILIYQEQIMHLAVGFGLDLSTGYRIVKASAKKKMNQLEEYRQQFLVNARAKDCDKETANKIFDMIVESGLYSFNKSHAISYALLSYASAYLKVHYPIVFMSHLLTYTYEKGKETEYETVLKDCKRQGIAFLPADINKSKWEFTVENNAIRIGLCAVKGFGEKAYETISDFDKINHFSDLITNVEKRKAGRVINSKVITVIIFSGILNDESDRVTLYEEYSKSKKKECPDRIKLGTKNFEFEPDAKYDELEKIFFGVNFIL